MLATLSMPSADTTGRKAFMRCQGAYAYSSKSCSDEYMHMAKERTWQPPWKFNGLRMVKMAVPCSCKAPSVYRLEKVYQ